MKTKNIYQGTETEKKNREKSTNDIAQNFKLSPYVQKLMQESGLTTQTTFYRSMHPLYIIGKNTQGNYIIEGNDGSQTQVYDHNNKKTSAAYLPQPGINVTEKPSKTYITQQRITIQTQLQDIFDLGGSIYRDIGSRPMDTKARYLTIPSGKQLAVNIEEHQKQAADWGVLYNSINKNSSNNYEIFNDDGEKTACNIIKPDQIPKYQEIHTMHYSIHNGNLNILEENTETDDKSIQKEVLLMSICRILMVHNQITEIIHNNQTTTIEQLQKEIHTL